MLTAIHVFLFFLAIYIVLGLVFGLYFIVAAPKVDHLLGDSKKVVRLLLLPGVVATWPFILIKLLKTKTS